MILENCYYNKDRKVDTHFHQEKKNSICLSSFYKDVEMISTCLDLLFCFYEKNIPASVTIEIIFGFKVKLFQLTANMLNFTILHFVTSLISEVDWKRTARGDTVGFAHKIRSVLFKWLENLEAMLLLSTNTLLLLISLKLLI